MKQQYRSHRVSPHWIFPLTLTANEATPPSFFSITSRAQGRVGRINPACYQTGLLS
ncbi:MULTISPECIES: hypothetical protein [Legionella]|uniref:hypothetical protein n=1 Tax=Legionella TaxID=445 RepID=UPI000A9EC584|nr:hypothetical protein [Legionella maceachernii]